MKIVFIYGAPGVGKLTTAQALATVTAAIPSRPAFEIDNSTLAADVVARRIAAHFSLPVRLDADRGGIRA